MIRRLSVVPHTIEKQKILERENIRIICNELYTTINIKFRRIELVQLLPPTSFICNHLERDIIIITFEAKCELYIGKSPNPRIEDKEVFPDIVLDKQSVYWIKLPEDCVMFTIHALSKCREYCSLLTNSA